MPLPAMSSPSSSSRSTTACAKRPPPPFHSPAPCVSFSPCCFSSSPFRAQHKRPQPPRFPLRPVACAPCGSAPTADSTGLPATMPAQRPKPSSRKHSSRAFSMVCKPPASTRYCSKPASAPPWPIPRTSSRGTAPFPARPAWHRPTTCCVSPSTKRTAAAWSCMPISSPFRATRCPKPNASDASLSPRACPNSAPAPATNGNSIPAFPAQPNIWPNWFAKSSVAMTSTAFISTTFATPNPPFPSTIAAPTPATAITAPKPNGVART